METNQIYPMESSVKIMRRSIFIFLQNYHYFTTIAALLAFPLSALALLADSSFPSIPIFRVIFIRFLSLFDAAGFPRSSDFFSFLNLTLSQTITTSFLIIPFTLTFLLLSKAYVIQVLANRKTANSASFFSIYSSLFLTQLCNILVIFSANATCICLLFVTFSCIDGLGLWTANSLLIFSATGGVLYSIILANALVICNLALTLSGMENRGGFLAILKSCLLIRRGRIATALSLAIPVNILLTGVEALFLYRIIRFDSPLLSIALEGLFIVYIYSVLLVLDSVISCTFYTSCKAATPTLEGRNSCWIDIEENNQNSYSLLKTLDDDLP